MHQSKNKREFFKPKLIQEIKKKRIKELRSSPNWEHIQQVVESIEQTTYTINTIKALDDNILKALTFKDFCGSDIAYHLITNFQFDQFIDILGQAESLFTSDFNQVIQSAIKGISQIKKENNHKKILAFIKQLTSILNTRRESEQAKAFKFNLDIVVGSRYNYIKNLWELKLLMNLYKLLGDFESEITKLSIIKKDLNIHKLLNSTQQERSQVSHLKIQLYFSGDAQNYINSILIKKKCWDLFYKSNVDSIFKPLSDGFTLYMRLLKAAPFDVLVEFHQMHNQIIKDSLNSQHKGTYNILHCISENKNPINQEFIQILQDLDLGDLKRQSYNQQIPLVLYLRIQKSINQNYLNYLSKDIIDQNHNQYEGLQLLISLYTRGMYQKYDIEKNRKIVKGFNNYKKKVKLVKKFNMRYKKIKPRYKLSKSVSVKQDKFRQQLSTFSDDIKNCAQNIYENTAAIHHIYYLKGIKQDFNITHYSFSLCHFDYNISKIDQPLAIWIQDSTLLDSFLNYLEKDFCSNINQEIKEAIEALLLELKHSISIDDLIIQRKIVILNALLKQNRTEQENARIKSQISNLLSKSQDGFRKVFCSYSKYQTFQDYLICNDLITIEAYQVNDAFESVINLLRLGHRNQNNILGLAEKVEKLQQYPSLRSLLQICFQQNNIDKLSRLDKWKNQTEFLDNLIQQNFMKSSLLKTPQGIELLYQFSDKCLHRDLLKNVLYNFQEACVHRFFQLFYEIESWDYFVKKKYSVKLFLCHLTQQQLGLVFNYQLMGMRTEFNFRLFEKKATTIQEEIVLRQVIESKNFLQVLVSNDKYSEFLQVSLKFYPLFQERDGTDYVLEALNNEAYKNLAILEQWIFDNFDECHSTNKYKNTIFSFLRHHSFLISGVFGKTSKKIDRVKFNRQIKNYFDIFERQIELQRKLEQPNIFDYNNHKKFNKSFICYLDKENTILFSEYIKQFFQSQKSSSLFHYIRNSENPAIPEIIHYCRNKRICEHLEYLNLITKDESELKSIILNLEMLQKSEQQGEEENSGIQINKFVILYYLTHFTDLEFIKPYFLKCNYHDIGYVFQKLLENNQFRTVEFILLNHKGKLKQPQIQLQSSKDTYIRALGSHWSITLTTNQFKDLVQNNNIENQEKEQILELLTNSGHFEKLEYVTNWINNNNQLIELTSIACSLLVKEYILQNKKFNNSNIPVFMYQKTSMNYTLSKLMNQSIETPYLQTYRLGTAKVLYNLVCERDVDLTEYYKNYLLFQILFPNTKWTFDNRECEMATQFLCLIELNLLKQNWTNYIEIILKNAVFYYEAIFDFSTVLQSKRNPQSWQSLKNMVDQLIPIYESISKESPSTNKLKQIQTFMNQTRTEKVKKNNFAKQLEQHFEDIQFQNLELNTRQANIYYGLPFESGTFNEVDLYVALMGRNQNSILKLLKNSSIPIATLLNKYNVIQYLIKHGNEDTVIEVLKLLTSSEIYESHFFHHGLPLLTYIVFKKWYRLYNFAQNYLINQWTLKPKIIGQTIKGQLQELTIHQFAQLNSFYVYFELPIQKQLILRTSQFLIPNSHNIQLKAYRVYSILKIMFNSMPLRKLEIISLLCVQIKDDTQISLENLFKKFGKNQLIEDLFLSIYDNQKNDKKELVLDLMSELGLSCSIQLDQFNEAQLEWLYKQIYHKYGHYHFLIEKITRLAPNSFINNDILNCPKLALIVAQHGRFDALQNLIDVQNFGQNYTKLVSAHFIKIILMVKYGQNFDPLIEPKEIEDIHLKHYVDALDFIESDQQGSISIQFMNQLIPILHVENSSVQYIDKFYGLFKSESSQIKKAFKIIIRLKEFNYELQQIELNAIAKCDYLVKNFKFQFGEKFGLVQSGQSSTIVIPFDYQENELELFLNGLPCFYKDLYENAISSKAFEKKIAIFKKKEKLIIKFEDKNLSPFYNDLRFLLPLLKEQKQPADSLEYKNEYQIKGWQQLSKKDHDDYCFVYTSDVKFSYEWAQTIFYQEPQKSEYFQKYQNQILIFFNGKTIFNQVEIQDQLSNSLKYLLNLSTQGLDLKCIIELESFMKVFFMNKNLYSVYNNWYNLINAISTYPTLIATLKHILTQVCQITSMFNQNSDNNQIIVKFETTDNQGISPKSHYLDDYFSFCKPSIYLEKETIVVTIPVSESGNKGERLTYLEEIFNASDLDQFIKEQFSLKDNLDALILRYQLEETAKQTCEQFRQLNNFDLLIKLDRNDIRQQIESFNYEQQLDYLIKFQTYFRWTLNLDLQNFIAGNRFSQFYKDSLCSGKYLTKPLDIGNFSQFNVNSLKNSFGIIQNKEQFLTNVKKKRIYHVFYTKHNRNHAVFCLFVKSIKDRNYFIQLDQFKLKKKYNKKTNLQIKSEYIKGAIYYTYEYDKQISKQNEKLVLIDFEGHYYLNQDVNFANQIEDHTTLSDNIKVTKLCFNLSFDRSNIGQNVLYFNLIDFRLKDYLETSSIQQDKSYDLQELKVDKSQIRIDPQLAEYNGYDDKDNKKEKLDNKKLNKMLLTILSNVSDHDTTPIQFEIPNQNTKLNDENLDSLTDYCKQYRKQQLQTRAGEFRKDKIMFYDCLNNLIRDKKVINDIQCYIQHEKFKELIHHPEVSFDDGVCLSWTPYIKGKYDVFVNGHLMNFKFSVMASKQIQSEKFKLIKDESEFQYFVEKDLRFELYDIYNNLITRSDELSSALSVQVMNSNFTVKNRCEYNDSGCVLYIQFCNYAKPDDKVDECKLEINLDQQTIIQGKIVQIKPQPLSQKRIDTFSSKFTYRNSVQYLIIRANFLNSLAQMDNHIGQKNLKFSFLQEVANDQGGPCREFFCLFGRNLKDPQNNLCLQTHMIGYYYLNKGILLLNDSITFAIGMLLAYAIANKLKVGISFALPFWKIICDLPLEFDDLSCVVEPQIYQSYQYLRNLKEDELFQQDIYFVNQSDEAELCENGKTKKVDCSNLEEYLNLSAQYILQRQYDKVFKQLKRGFQGQFDAKLLIQNFALFEINQLIDIIDYQINKEKLLKCIHFSRKNQINENYFTQYISEADQEKLEHLLTFATGSKYSNFENFKIEIQTNLEFQKNRLPVSRTCSNVVIIPQYPTYDDFKAKMDMALDWGLEFFGQG
ncbi:unnamed protein product (macronuclear) [Paramecium tetraurelia]|uniref:HECT-type E3 ubiquitin transferase n=1 Tax=Paramecium tetraurelia TaxID=5888 RepID=A0DLB8_PARTE|nr:uncharacterized protein GSPATT00018152001 [Paramecium tetraurelia]CAK83835.1 unnamed protein product [Paramecium tetraurelia]|eukprot:XP_001451232.1 hypothetical protein (macronuclear) [Paramecium tetraurelia strain d4-2]